MLRIFTSAVAESLLCNAHGLRGALAAFLNEGHVDPLDALRSANPICRMVGLRQWREFARFYSAFPPP